MEYYTFQEALKKLQMDEDELKSLIEEGEIRAVTNKQGEIQFAKSEIEAMVRDKMSNPTLMMASDAELFAESKELSMDESGLSSKIESSPRLGKAEPQNLGMEWDRAATEVWGVSGSDGEIEADEVEEAEEAEEAQENVEEADQELWAEDASPDAEAEDASPDAEAEDLNAETDEEEWKGTQTAQEDEDAEGLEAEKMDSAILNFAQETADLDLGTRSEVIDALVNAKEERKLSLTDEELEAEEVSSEMFQSAELRGAHKADHDSSREEEDLELEPISEPLEAEKAIRALEEDSKTPGQLPKTAPAKSEAGEEGELENWESSYELEPLESGADLSAYDSDESPIPSADSKADTKRKSPAVVEKGVYPPERSSRPIKSEQAKPAKPVKSEYQEAFAGKKSSQDRWKSIAAVVSLVLGFTAVVGYLTKGPGVTETPVSVLVAQEISEPQIEKCAATLLPGREVIVETPAGEKEGDLWKVEKLYKKKGDTVQAEESLCYLAFSVAASLQEKAQKDLAAAETNLQSVQSELEKVCQEGNVSVKERKAAYVVYESLRKQNVLGSKLSQARARYDEKLKKFNELRKRYDTLNMQKAAAKTSVQNAIAQCQELQKPRKTAEIKSPMAGQIADCQLQEGKEIAVNQPVFRLCELKKLRLVVRMSESAYSQLHPQEKIPIALKDDPDEDRLGTIIQVIGPSPEEREIHLELDNSENNLRPNQEVTVHFRKKASLKRMFISTKAVVFKKGESYVFVVKDNLCHERKITLGQKKDKDQNLEVLAGLSSGEQVVISEANSLKEGQAVIVH